MADDIAALFIVIAITLLMLTGAAAVVIGIVGVTTDRRCLRAGYAGSNVTFNLERFCVSRVAQTDVVVPLEVAERGSR